MKRTERMGGCPSCRRSARRFLVTAKVMRSIGRPPAGAPTLKSSGWSTSRKQRGIIACNTNFKFTSCRAPQRSRPISIGIRLSIGKPQTIDKVPAGFHRSRRHARRERDTTTRTHPGGGIRTFGQRAARKFQGISGARSFLPMHRKIRRVFRCFEAFHWEAMLPSATGFSTANRDWVGIRGARIAGLPRRRSCMRRRRSRWG